MLLGGFSSAADWALNQYSGLSRAEKQQNEFNASEAAKARDFSAAQAEQQMDWQEEMYQKYNSLQGKMEQAREAGVNPMYAVTGNAVSHMSPSGPSVAAPSASGSSSRGPSPDMVGSLLSFSKLKAEIDNINAQTRNANARATLDEIDAATRGEMNEASISQAMQAISTSKADEGFKIAQTGEVAARVLNTEADTSVKTAQLGQIASDIANTDADTAYKVKSLESVAAQIANTEADTDLKAAQILYVGAQTRSEKLMSGLITQNAHLSRQQRKESEARVREIYQRYDHNEVMQSLQRASADLEYRNQVLHTPKNAFEASIKWLLESAVEVLSFGGYTSYSHSENTSTNTTTVIDGNPQPVRNRVGF